MRESNNGERERLALDRLAVHLPARDAYGPDAPQPPFGDWDCSFSYGAGEFSTTYSVREVILKLIWYV
jgi:hypothetical protein